MSITADLASDLDQCVEAVTRLNRRISVLAERRNRITRAMRLLSLQADAQAARLRDLVDTADAAENEHHNWRPPHGG